MAAGTAELSKPIRLGDIEQAAEFPCCMFGMMLASHYMLENPLTSDSLVCFPGNDRHGIWSAKQLRTIVPTTDAPGYPELSSGDMRTVRWPPESSQPRPKKASNPTQDQQQTPEPQQKGKQAPFPASKEREEVTVMSWETNRPARQKGNA